MENFIHDKYTKLIFGKDNLGTLGENIKKYTDKKILITYGGGSIKRNGLYDEAVKVLKDEGIEFLELSGIKPNPEVDTARKGIDIIKKEGIELVLAIGGGSVLDNTKHMAIGAGSEVDIWEMVKTRDTSSVDPKKMPKVASIITLAATGSEMNAGGVMSNPEEELKLGLFHPLVAPVFTYENPQMLFTLSDYQRRAGLCDIISHLMEQYFSTHKDEYIVDRLVEAILKNVIDHKDNYINETKNYEVAGNIFWSSTLSLNGLVSMGRKGGDWLSHAMEHEISATTDLTHGIGLAIVQPAVLKYYFEKDKKEGLDRVKYRNLAVNVFGHSKDEEALDEKGLKGIVDLFYDIAKVGKLEEVDIKEFDYKESAKKLLKVVGSTYHKLDEKDFEKIYESIL